MSLFETRRIQHDKKEEEVMNIIRPYTDRRHLPDRWIAFRGMLCAWDMKTNIFVEKNSHDEYFRVFKHDGIPVFIVYQDQENGLMADWINRLEWRGPFPPSPKSTSGDPYYRISGGKPLMEFLKENNK